MPTEDDTRDNAPNQEETKETNENQEEKEEVEIINDTAEGDNQGKNKEDTGTLGHFTFRQILVINRPEDHSFIKIIPN